MEADQGVATTRIHGGIIIRPGDGTTIGHIVQLRYKAESKWIKGNPRPSLTYKHDDGTFHIIQMKVLELQRE